MNPGEPTSAPVRVRPSSPAVSSARAMPKSMTRGPSIVTSTLDGLRSRWMSPAAWMSRRAPASPAARERTELSGSGPWSRLITDSRDGPATYPVATHGTSASVSASRTGAVQSPPTRRAAPTSWRNRARNSSRSASSRRTSFTATVRPRSDRARYTFPMPPAPSRASSRYPPMTCGSPAPSCSTAAPSSPGAAAPVPGTPAENSDRRGSRPTRARVRFRPAPDRDRAGTVSRHGTHAPATRTRDPRHHGPPLPATRAA